MSENKITWEESFKDFWHYDPEISPVNLAEHVDEEIAKQIYEYAFKQGGKQPWWTINKQQLQVLLKGK